LRLYCSRLAKRLLTTSSAILSLKR
jgi:hypothetical protein